MSYEVRLSHRAAKDLDAMGRDTRERILRRLDQLGESPRDARTSSLLTNLAGLRKSRVGGWRVIFAVDDDTRIGNVVTIERRGQVYRRI